MSQTATESRHEPNSSGSVKSIADAPAGLVKDHAIPSAAVAFGIGVGAGLTIAGLLVGSIPPRQTSTTQRLRDQMLAAMDKVLPNALS